MCEESDFGILVDILSTNIRPKDCSVIRFVLGLSSIEWMELIEPSLVGLLQISYGPGCWWCYRDGIDQKFDITILDPNHNDPHLSTLPYSAERWALVWDDPSTSVDTFWEPLWTPRTPNSSCHHLWYIIPLTLCFVSGWVSVNDWNNDGIVESRFPPPPSPNIHLYICHVVQRGYKPTSTLPKRLHSFMPFKMHCTKALWSPSCA